MKNGTHQTNWVVVWITMGALLSAMLTPRAAAQAGNSAAPSASPTPATNSATIKTETGQQEKAPAIHSRNLAEILKLVDAGVSKEIIKSFIENSSIVFEVSAADIVTLKQRGVSDEVTTALLKRSAEVRALVNRERGTIAAPAIVRALSTDGSLDPDSYEFWWYHYAYPRALSESYRTLSPYYPAHYPSYYPGYQSRYSPARTGFRSSSFPRGRR